MNETVLEIQNFTRIYSKNGVGVKNLNFTVKSGSFHAFLGENGAGKTTTIKSIVGATYNFVGDILIKGINNKTSTSKSIIGYVPEKAQFPSELTTYEYLKSLALLNNLPKHQVEEKLSYLLNKFNIEELSNKKPSYFSSGQKKKVLLIQALIHDPELIILDEPAANLDPTARYELFKLLNSLKQEGKTIFISSHILAEIDPFVDSLTLLHKGELVYSGDKYKNLEEIYYEKIIKK